MRPGTTVYSNNDCGDWTPATGSVVIPKGIEATFEGVRECPQVKAPRAFFSIPTSPGQKTLTCMPDQIATFWSEQPPPKRAKPAKKTAKAAPEQPPPPPYESLNVWERLRRNPYAEG